MSDRPRITSLPPDAITEWVSREPDDYFAAVRQDALALVEAEAARARQQMWEQSPWLRRATWGLILLTAIWILTGIVWGVWTVLT